MNKWMLSLMACGAVSVGVTMAPSASARTVVFVHGRNTGIADANDYWHIGYGAGNDGVLGFTGSNTRSSKVYAYDASAGWDDYGAAYNSTKPVCALTQAMHDAAASDGDLVILSHSAGGVVAMEFLRAQKTGAFTNCNWDPGGQYGVPVPTYFVPVAAPFRGTEVANAVYGGTGGNFLQRLCGSVAGSIANLLFNQANPMTYELQTSYMNNHFTSSSSTSAIYPNFGTGTQGDDGTALSGAAYCANVETYNDGFIGPSSAIGCARGSINWTNAGNKTGSCLAGGHVGWYSGISHSSNRRDDSGTFATNVWNYNPY